MEFSNINLFLAIFQVILILIIGPLVNGLFACTRQYLTGQRDIGTSVCQPWRNLFKLFKKKDQTSQLNKGFAIIGPLLSFIAIVLAASMIPLFTYDTLGHLFWGDDLFLMLGLLLLSKFFQSMISFDAPACFSTMGTGRAMMVHSATEPVFFLIILGLALIAGNTSIWTVLHFKENLSTPTDIFMQIPYLFLLISLYLNILMECGRIPYDNPATHLELTMIEKGARIERSGSDLAFAEWGESIKILIFMLLISNVVINKLSSLFQTDISLLFNFIIIAVIIVLTVFVELAMPRYRVGDLPRQSLASMGLALLAVCLIIIIPN